MCVYYDCAFAYIGMCVQTRICEVHVHVSIGNSCILGKGLGDYSGGLRTETVGAVCNALNYAN